MVKERTIARTEKTADTVIYPPQIGCCCLLEKNGELIRTSTVTNWYHDATEKVWCIFTLNSIYRIQGK